MSMKKLAIVVLAVGISLPAFAALSWVGEGYAILDVNDSGNTWYDLDATTGNPDFDNDNSSSQAYSLTLEITEGQSIKLGGQVQSWDTNGDSAYIAYRVSSDWSGSFSEVNLPYKQAVGENDQWEESDNADMAEIGSGLSQGTHYLELYMRAYDSDTTSSVFGNEGGTGGNNWEARINVIPEPTSLLLTGGIAAFVLLFRRILRK